MRIQKTHDTFIKQIAKIHPEINILGQYQKCNIHIKCGCKICGHEWDGLPYNLLKETYMCPECSKKKLSLSKLKSTKQFIDEMNEINPNVEILGEYVHSKEKIKCKCRQCGHLWETTPNNLLTRKSGCPVCTQRKRIELSKEVGKATPRAKAHDVFIKEMMIKNSNIEILGKYVTNKTKIKCRCKICEHVWYPIPNGLLSGLGCPLCGRRKASQNKTLTNEEFQKRLALLKPKYRVIDEYTNCETKVQCICNICNGEWKAKPIKLLNGHGCPICSGFTCVTGINDIATKRPDLVKYFVDVNVAYANTLHANKRFLCKCPDCGYEKEMAINVLTDHGFSCDVCRDNISYPNKYLRGFLSQLPINNVKYEYSPEWVTPYRYDCYFMFKSQPYIIEMDGELGHGQKSFNSKEKDIDGLKRDKIKEELALNHNIILIRIDCIKSDSEYISNNILSSELSQVFDLSLINWDLCNEYATKNIVKEVCDYYNQTLFSGTQIAKNLNMGQTTVYRYLRKGKELGWCDYNPQS